MFDANRDKNIYAYLNWGKGIESKFISGEASGQLVYRATALEPTPEKVLGLQHYFGDKLKGRQAELNTYTKLVVRARSTNNQALQMKLALITADAAPYAAPVTLTDNFQELEIPLSSLKPDACMLLPRPYPDFQPFWFKPAKPQPFNLA